MSKAILICGRICCGKTTYAKKLLNRSVLLSVDEITLSVFGQHIGEKHDEYCERIQQYLFRKSLEIIAAGTDAVLDWGFWRKDERAAARAFYHAAGVPCELHYIVTDEQTWRERLEKRNRDVEAGKVSAYYVDQNLAAKFAGLFEPPTDEEIDVFVREER